ncbi:uncharacterized protein LOC130630693 [Hydractinia symbiolongicarpus]|uniref:uncharacterized protein LOC130630693 n=1 Tax=Hydractinia symbiolongicarpus TaxID=13093 RepID=UPI00254ACD41|nr:uncharacterized protein LOC130630693 [Hydractinia symbiolongicarpus]
MKVNLNRLNDKLENSETIVDDLRNEKAKLKRKTHSLLLKIENQKKLIDHKEVNDMKCLKSDYDKLCTNMKQLTEENRDLQMLVSLLNDNEIVTFEGGRYSDEIREVVMELLSLNVSMGKVNDVIKVVLEKLAKKRVDRLPSQGLKSHLMQEALILAQLQVAEAMIDNDKEAFGNCLHGDGTSKYHKHYQNFQITTSKGKTLTFGLSEVAGGDAATVMKNFTDTIDDMCDILKECDKDANFSRLVTSIKSTMSDLGPINPLFNSQLKSLREKLLPNVVENWNYLSETQKTDMTDMGNFFCKLHLLANFASEADKVLHSFERMVLCDDYETVFAFNSAKESSASRLVRTACKAFHVRGSDECGVASYFNSFLAGRNQKSYFVPFIGNRFYILFYNAAALYYHRDAVVSFLSSWPDPNNLLKAVNEDVSNKLFLNLALLINY